MKTLREYIKEAEEKKIAIGHFNVSNLEMLHGVLNARAKVSEMSGVQIPVIIGLSEKEEDFMDRYEAVAIVHELREKENLPVFLNADHHYSLERAKKSVDVGFDSVIIDCADKSFEENVKITKECVDYVKDFNKKNGKDVLVEAELGYIGAGSNIKESIPEGAGIFTTREDAKKFVEMTGIDMLAPSVGSIHGLIKSGKPHINADLVASIRMSAGVPLVLHGGSGLRDEDFTNAINAGISIIHISTELRVAYNEALKKSLAENPNELAPYKTLTPAVEAVQKVAEEKIKLFNNLEQ